MGLDRRTLLVNGVECNVIVEGEGPDVLLVHGFPDDHTVWRNQIPALVAAGYRVIAPDTRGCGDTGIPPCVADYHIDRLVADLVGILDALGIEKVRLVGHDWGAVQGWHLAIRHPERVERYIAMSVGHPTAYARGGLEQKLRGFYVFLFQLRGLVELLLTSCNWWLFRLWACHPDEFPFIRRRLARPGRLTAGLNYYRANLGLLFAWHGARVRVPVVGVWSSRDRFLTERQMLKSAEFCAAGWTYVRIDGVNHWAQLADAERVNRLLLEHMH